MKHQNRLGFREVFYSTNKNQANPSKRSARLKQLVNLRARADVLHLKDIIKPQSAHLFFFCGTTNGRKRWPTKKVCPIITDQSYVGEIGKLIA